MRVGNGEFTLTTYEGAPATPQEIANETAPLAAAFPQIQDAFMAVLAERIISEQWPAERVRDAVNYTIATAKYPTFQMAQFLSFDRPVKLYNHYGYQRLREEGYTDYGGCQGDSEIGKTEPINGHVYFYLKKDLPNFLIGKKIF